MIAAFLILYALYFIIGGWVLSFHVHDRNTGLDEKFRTVKIVANCLFIVAFWPFLAFFNLACGYLDKTFQFSAWYRIIFRKSEIRSWTDRQMEFIDNAAKAKNKRKLSHFMYRITVNKINKIRNQTHK